MVVLFLIFWGTSNCFPLWLHQLTVPQTVHKGFLFLPTLGSVQFSHSVVSDSLRYHERQHARPPCPSPTPGVYSNSCPLSQWCYPTISSSVVPFSSCPQSFPASGPFQMSKFFTSGGQRIGVSASTSVLPMNTQVLTQPGQKEIEPSPQEREEWPWTRSVEMVSKRS